MSEGKERFVIGPDGERLTSADLPGPNIVRWVPRRKAKVVAAVEGGLISREAAIKRYSLSGEEFEAWRDAFSRMGMRGLRVSKVHELRRLTRMPDDAAKPRVRN